MGGISVWQLVLVVPVFAEAVPVLVGISSPMTILGLSAFFQ